MVYDETGSIIAVGSLNDVEPLIGSDALRLDAKSRMVLPGFIDTHVHVPEAGINETLCLLPTNESIEVYENLIRQCAKTQSGDYWVRVAGASLFNIRNSDELPLQVLDRSVPD